MRTRTLPLFLAPLLLGALACSTPSNNVSTPNDNLLTPVTTVTHGGVNLTQTPLVQNGTNAPAVNPNAPVVNLSYADEYARNRYFTFNDEWQPVQHAVITMQNGVISWRTGGIEQEIYLPFDNTRTYCEAQASLTSNSRNVYISVLDSEHKLITSKHFPVQRFYHTYKFELTLRLNLAHIYLQIASSSDGDSTVVDEVSFRCAQIR